MMVIEPTRGCEDDDGVEEEDDEDAPESAVLWRRDSSSAIFSLAASSSVRALSLLSLSSRIFFCACWKIFMAAGEFRVAGSSLGGFDDAEERSGGSF